MRQPAEERKGKGKALKVAGLAAPVQIRRHPTARRLTLRVNHVRREVVLTMPERGSMTEAGQFVAKHLDWVRERLEALPEPVPFADGGVVLYRGEPHVIHFIGPSRHRRVAWTEGVRAAQIARRQAELEGGRRGRISKDHLPRICVSGEYEHAPRRLRDWLIERAREDLSRHIAFHAANLKVRPRRVTVRDQTSRWGSCSSARVLSFSWRLILAPPVVLEYVAAHEVAHLREMNHGPRFWAQVRKTMPHMDEARAWLARHGGELHRYAIDLPAPAE